MRTAARLSLMGRAAQRLGGDPASILIPYSVALLTRSRRHRYGREGHPGLDSRTERKVLDVLSEDELMRIVRGINAVDRAVSDVRQGKPKPEKGPP
jgi:hypothetical protein